ncbi:hypothetical protein XOC_0999 [Xanthomonas oryzae pv. oryzicola BLS256]|uniref:Uncharacterized protein n=1 Tax=Xanthomonas oryzae pv. oryzicola (strain BLS256) TaxID=383407 RepID=G7TEM6_XANOB|nr:hypothetical protein XOC_0999 [Xanthomonas oryzae pv. oryzicola BLS256]QEO98918.1 hypothetical protein XOCgx_3931 [Xanthomonas oryzae pv. oryzicola]
MIQSEHPQRHCSVACDKLAAIQGPILRPGCPRCLYRFAP